MHNYPQKSIIKHIIKEIELKEKKREKKILFAIFCMNVKGKYSNDLENETQRNEQAGYCNIFAGAMQAIRNEKAHHNTPITKEKAIKRLIFASLLFDKIDIMKKNPSYPSRDIS